MSSFFHHYQRQAKLYIDLPSKGVFYNESIIEDNQVTSMPVFGMNAMDEITFKTPDALFTGVATSTVMNSCIPHIKDPWNLVGYDIDYILIAIRIATYGDTMPISTRCPHCSEQNDSEILLTKLLENFAHCNITSSFNISDLKINMAPLTYRQTTDFSMENFQIERKMLQIGNDETISKDDKETLLQGVFVESSDLNLRLAVSYIESIENENDKEEDQANILEFIKNNDAEFYTKLREGNTKLTDDWNLPNIDVLCGNDECNKEFKTSLNLDYSNFFGSRSLHSRSLI